MLAYEKQSVGSFYMTSAEWAGGNNKSVTIMSYCATKQLTCIALTHIVATQNW